MTAPTPIYDALTVLRRAITQALRSLTTVGVYWTQAEQGVALPYVIYQSQDGGGRATRQIGAFGWEGLITVRALANNQSAAELLMQTVLPGMAMLAAPSYTVAVSYERPIVIPPANGVWQAGHIWRIAIN